MRSPEADRWRELDDVPYRGLEPWLLVAVIVAIVCLAYIVGLL